MTEHELLLDCLKRLNKSQVAYMLTGSMASNAWGIPRTTHDLDFVIQLPPSHIKVFAEAFSNPDYCLDESTIRAAYNPPHQFNIIHVPSALKADFWLLRPDPFEKEMFKRRVQDQWFGERIWLATAEDVILHKLHWSRITPSDRQLSDVAGVVKVQRGILDHAYLRQWAATLQVSAQLEAVLSGAIRPKTT